MEQMNALVYKTTDSLNGSGKSKLSEEPKISFEAEQSKAFIPTTVRQRHFEHLARLGAAPPAQPSLGCHLLGRLLITQSRPPPRLFPDDPSVTVFIVCIRLRFS